MKISKEHYILKVAVIFFIIGVLHLYRSVMSLPMNIGSWIVPVWLSYVAAVILLLLAWYGFKLRK